MLSPLATTALAIGVLTTLGLILVAVIVAQVRNSHYTAAQSAIYGLNYVVSRILWRAEVQGRIAIPFGQGAVLVCNHNGPIDPAFIQLMTGRRVVHWMVAKEYCEHPLLRWFFHTCEAIAVGRGGIDTAATKMAIRYAQEGQLVGLFPEGRVNRGPDILLPGRPGATLIALKARVPVIPCFLSGSPYTGMILGPLVTPAKVKLVIGEPIDISAYYGRENERQVLEELTLKFLREMAKLAGQPDFQPKLAGRFYKEGSENGGS
jgi:1-acyl-sn-glycerol-3-phosphate acyltransferase